MIALDVFMHQESISLYKKLLADRITDRQRDVIGKMLAEERKRQLGQARHCHNLANSYDDARVKQELSAIGKVVDGELARRQTDGSQASPQQMQRLSGSASLSRYQKTP
jgi:hypothetical protein